MTDHDDTLREPRYTAADIAANDRDDLTRERDDLEAELRTTIIERDDLRAENQDVLAQLQRAHAREDELREIVAVAAGRRIAELEAEKMDLLSQLHRAHVREDELREIVAVGHAREQAWADDWGDMWKMREELDACLTELARDAQTFAAAANRRIAELRAEIERLTDELEAGKP